MKENSTNPIHKDPDSEQYSADNVFVTEKFMSSAMLSSIVTFIGLFIILAGTYIVATQPQKSKIVGIVVIGIGVFDIVAGLLFAKYLRPDNR